ncbi:hypothetical protein PDQ77_28560 [Bacillus cereus]|nr:hypothetical protein [Bacillus cereus]MBJ7956043.1 hypothetical protein [Bacillus cereus]MBT0793347.1 hypothetical protein [Bacillus cereus]MDA2650682.1 hypothetical protein [Bacillus cereus]MDZ4454041.1 hypothetical protein [Bacillus cereus]MDZ4545225.1 hypothetical protein [Bacillus cereus]
MEKQKCSLKEARNAYLRKWRAENRDKVKKYNETYWQKKAKEMEEQACQK